MKKYINEDGTPFSKEQFIDKIKNDKEFSDKFGNLGPIYGKQWRNWKTYKHKMNFEPYLPVNKDGKVECYVEYVDQIANLINDLKTNPDSRRLMVSAWNAGELEQMVLPPCHYGFQVYTRELSWDERHELAETKYQLDDTDEELDKHNIPTRAISLSWNQRSVDTFLGLPFNIASYGLLLEIIAKEVNMVPEELIGNLGDVHLYSNHVEQAKEQIGRELTEEERYSIWFSNNYETGMERYFDPNNVPDYDNDYYVPTPKRTREPYPLPTLDIHPGILDYDLDKLDMGMFTIKNYQSHPTIKAPLSN